MLPYPYMAVGGRSPLVGRSKVPGSKNIVRKNKIKAINEDSDDKDMKKKHQIETQVHDKQDYSRKKIRRKRQAFFQQDDAEGYDLNDILQDALVNEYKREMIFGRPQPEAQQLASLRDETQPLRIPLPGLQPMYDAAQQQAENPMLRQMSLNALSANYVAPLERYNTRNLGNMMASSRVPLNSLALGRSELPPDQLRMMPTMQQRMPAMSPRMPMESSRMLMQSPSPLMRGYPGSQPLDPSRPAEYIGAPMAFRAEYRSPVQYEERPRNRRKYGRHPVYRRRLHHRRYDDVYDEDNDDDDDDDREMYHPEHLGKERVSLAGSYSENEVPNDQGQTLVDTNNHGFGPITVEAKTAEGVRKSLGEDSRSDITKPDDIPEAPQKKSLTKHRQYPLRAGVL
jgi:hypothetical protein